MPFQQVAIFGLGLIGASLGLALKRATAPPRVVGFDTSGEALHRAARIGAIDRSAGTLADACAGSDGVVLAAPVRAILQLLPEIAPHLTSETLVTDTGGTKQEIVRVADSTLPHNAPFVGGHPLAGRLTAGVGQPAANLFSGAVYCLTPSPNAAPWAVETAVALVESVGAQPYFLEAGEHARVGADEPGAAPVHQAAELQEALPDLGRARDEIGVEKRRHRPARLPQRRAPLPQRQRHDQQRHLPEADGDIGAGRTGHARWL